MADFNSCETMDWHESGLGLNNELSPFAEEHCSPTDKT
jgi:hypothetical protein